jgi:hypothetical protein
MKFSVKPTGDHYVVVDELGNFFAKTYSSVDAAKIAALPTLIGALKEAETFISDEVERRGDSDSCYEIKAVPALSAVHYALRASDGAVTPRVPCDCGCSDNAYWDGEDGSRRYACEACHESHQ